MVNLLLGNTSSGKTRYMYSIALEKCKEGNNCLIISNEDSFLDLKEKLKTENLRGSMELVTLDTTSNINIGETINNEIGNAVDFVYLDLMGLSNKQIDNLLNTYFEDVKVYMTFQLSNNIDKYKTVVSFVNDALPTEKINTIALIEKLEESIIVWTSKDKDDKLKFLNFKNGIEFSLENLKELIFTEIKTEEE